MAQIFSLEKQKNKLDNIVNKSNKVKLLVVETPTKNVKSICNVSSDKMNFRFMIKRCYKINNIVLQELNKCFAG